MRFRLTFVWLDMIFSVELSLLDSMGDTDDAWSFDEKSIGSWFNMADNANDPLRFSSSDFILMIKTRKSFSQKQKKKKKRKKGI